MNFLSLFLFSQMEMHALNTAVRGDRAKVVVSPVPYRCAEKCRQPPNTGEYRGTCVCVIAHADTGRVTNKGPTGGCRMAPLGGRAPPRVLSTEAYAAALCVAVAGVCAAVRSAAYSMLKDCQ